MNGEQHTLVTTIRTGRRWRAGAAAAVAAAAALVAVAPAVSAASGRPGPGPGPAKAVNEELNAIKATSATNLWVLGHSDSTGAPLIWRGNGRTWTRIPVPGRVLRGGTVADIAAAGPDSAWAVGSIGSSSTLILHWNGNRGRARPARTRRGRTC